MTNEVKAVVFPLSGGRQLQEYSYFDRGVSSIPYAYVPLDKLRKAVEGAHTQDTEVTVTDSISVYVTRDSTSILARVEYTHYEGPDVFTPELYTTVNYDWLLEQVKTIEEGAEYTGHCLLYDNRLIVRDVEGPYHSTIPTTLLELLGTAVKELLQSEEGFASLHVSSIWHYFTRFITVTEGTPRKVEVSDNAKRLLADMQLRGMQGTTVWHVLQSICGIVNDL